MKHISFMLTIVLFLIAFALPAFAQLSPGEQGVFDFIFQLGAKYKVLSYIVYGLSTLVVLGLVYVKITPTKTDDNWVAKVESKPVVGTVLKIIAAFSPIQRKDTTK